MNSGLECPRTLWKPEMSPFPLEGRAEASEGFSALLRPW